MMVSINVRKYPISSIPSNQTTVIISRFPFVFLINEEICLKYINVILISNFKRFNNLELENFPKTSSSNFLSSERLNSSRLLHSAKISMQKQIGDKVND